jgi:predicted nucleotide-binding protein
MKPFFVKPKIFISHGLADQAMLETLKEFLILLNTDPILVITEPNRGLTINEKVIDPLEKCDCVIILATADNENIQKKDNYQPRANVSHEIGVAQKCQKNIIYLKQKNVDFGSNYGSQIWYEFEDNCKESIYPVLPKILSELVSFNLVSVSGKPHQELIRSSIVDQLYELIRLLGIEDQKIKANLLNLF